MGWHAMNRVVASLLSLTAGFAVAAHADESDSVRTVVDWSNAQPVASLSVRPIPFDEAAARGNERDGLFFIEGTVVDLNTGATLMKPRLVVHRGHEASIESGIGERKTMKLTVRIESAADRASTVTELRDDGVVISQSTTRFAFARL